MPEIVVDIDMWCAECGTELAATFHFNYKTHVHELSVEVCGKCANSIFRSGYDDGFSDGKMGHPPRMVL